jgi:glycosyltransferase involved in cell wall biosynthesis
MAKGARILQLSLDRPDPDALGGVAVHVAALSLHAPANVTVFTAHPSAGELLVEAWAPRRLVAALPVQSDDGASALAAAIVGTDATVLHVHSPQFGPDVIARAVRATGVRLTVALHDHSLVCENYELLEDGSRYCGIPMDLARCDRCLVNTRRRPPGALVLWREATARLVDATDAVIAPSRSVLEHAGRVHPSIAARARHIPWGVPAAGARRERAAAESGPLRVAVVGVWAKVKGREQLPALLSACRHLDVEWHLFGATEGASLADVERSGTVVVHGAYRRAVLAARLVAARCHVVALPSVGAETFSLALSEVTAAGFPVLASDLGALGERVREDALGWLFDPFDPSSFARVVAHLASNREELERVAVHVAALPRRGEVRMAIEHADLWTEVGEREARARAGTGSPGTLDETRRTALSAFEAGVLRAGHLRPSRLDALFDFAKKTDFYRDLRLRRLLSERTRKAIESVLRRPSYGGARAKDRR